MDNIYGMLLYIYIIHISAPLPMDKSYQPGNPEPWKTETIEWLRHSYEKHPGDNFYALWLPEYPVLDDNIDDNFFMPKRYVIMGNVAGNIELPRIMGSVLVSSYNIDYCIGAHLIQTANGFCNSHVRHDVYRKYPNRESPV